jgi:hypothetical protein
MTTEDPREGGHAMSVYGPSTVNRRSRAELAAVDDAIIAAIMTDSPVTLRGVFYRVVSAGAVDKTELGYRLVGRQLLKLRRAGVVGYGAITDGTRFLRTVRTWDSVEDALRDTAATYRRMLWDGQRDAVLMFTEKDAISGVITPVADRWDVPVGVLRGYSSESFAWLVAQHICAIPREVCVYQLGDHDPSGLDAWRAFRQRVREFVDEADERGESVADGLVFTRLAVTAEQITGLGLPTRPTKRTDSRAAGFAGGSVEVDAIPAPRLRQMVEDAIRAHIDPEVLGTILAAEQSEREILTRMANRGGTEP